jgi:hypothetical protein
MAEHRRRRTLLLLALLLLVALLLGRCACKESPAAPPADGPAPATASGPGDQGARASDVAPPEEDLTPATLDVPATVPAGSQLLVAWTGPDNRGDFVTIVALGAPADATGPYRETKEAAVLELTAPIEPGSYELRYVTARSRTILGRAPLEVEPVDATLDAPGEVVLGSQVSVAWSGPDNTGDYVTLVPASTPDGQYGNYTLTAEGSPLTVVAPTTVGAAELRYMTGQGGKVLARRALTIVAAEVTLSAPDHAVAGSRIEVAWTGPNHTGDYITVVPADWAEGRYLNYTQTSSGSPLAVLLPVDAGDGEVRYMTGQGSKVLARRPIRIVAAEVTLNAPDEAAAGSAVGVEWTGPDNPGDYITLVPKDLPDGQYRHYAQTSSGSPLKVNALADAGEAELRYMTGQGAKVLARRAIRIVP